MSNILKQLRGDSVLPVFREAGTFGTPIKSLFTPCGPPAILRCVRAVWVAAINGMGWCGLVAHVAKEAGEIMDPFVTDDDPAATVIAKRLSAWVIAALFHGNPCRVFGRVNAMAVATAFAVFRERAMNALQSETSARNDKPLRQMSSANVGLLPAVALTSPVRIPPTWREFRHCNQSSEPNASVVTLTHRLEYSTMVLVL